MGGGIKVKKGEYFLDHFIRLHGQDVILYGEGFFEIVHLHNTFILQNNTVTKN